MNEILQRGKKLYQTRLYRLAIEELKRAEKDGELLEPEISYYIGLSYSQLKEWEKALFYLEQVINANYSMLHDYQCRMVLGYIYSITGRYKLAEYEFKKTLESGFESVQVYASLGHVAYLERRLEDSVKYLKKSLALDSNYPNALNSLGFIFAEEEIDIPKALLFCRKAVTHKPNSPAYLDSLGWANYKAGRFTEARTHLRKALELLPGNKDIGRHLKIVIAGARP